MENRGASHETTSSFSGERGKVTRFTRALDSHAVVRTQWFTKPNKIVIDSSHMATSCRFY